MKKLSTLLILCALNFCLLSACSPNEAAPIPISGLSLAPLGKTPLLELKHLYEGKPTIVNFWASWCAPCRAEHPVLMKLAQKKYRVFGIAYRDNEDNAQRFLRTLGNPFGRVGLDKTGYAALGWGIKGVPETFVLDGEGRIVYHHLGPLTNIKSIEAAVEAALKQAQPAQP